ncbi:type II-A CRISPR-associated protein Csn2 [uncultured Ruminococcus sp.]|uniref:type II-A CRISPR-associated protein Csn2 n=1 Tax=uncultured Ruminococcus sp. TaxID=165186 RepID=UPI0025CD20A3|nr:type II-A CRISPR-associated protein Csn2 [uncultured Ruminococcus sp.]
MTIAYPKTGLFCELEEDKVLNLIIENQYIFSSVISDIHYQLNGENGDLVLAENFHPLDMRKNAELITQIIPFEINQRELINKLYTELKNVSVNENNYQFTQQLMTNVSAYIYTLSDEIDNELTIETPQDISGILKAFGVSFTENDLKLHERIIEYMTAVNKFKGERVFFFVNLRSYLTDEQTQLLYQNILLKKMTAVCIENVEHTHLKTSKTIIIDKDMCVI